MRQLEKFIELVSKLFSSLNKSSAVICCYRCFMKKASGKKQKKCTIYLPAA
jgi:hypothetical protein